MSITKKLSKAFRIINTFKLIIICFLALRIPQKGLFVKSFVNIYIFFYNHNNKKPLIKRGLFIVASSTSEYGNKKEGRLSQSLLFFLNVSPAFNAGILARTLSVPPHHEHNPCVRWRERRHPSDPRPVPC